MRQNRPVRVEVIEAPQPIDLDAWVEILLREILPLNGIAVRAVGGGEPEPMRRAS
jgi:hypothetical protein